MQFQTRISDLANKISIKYSVESMQYTIRPPADGSDICNHAVAITAERPHIVSGAQQW